MPIHRSFWCPADAQLPFCGEELYLPLIGTGTIILRRMFADDTLYTASLSPSRLADPLYSLIIQFLSERKGRSDYLRRLLNVQPKQRLSVAVRQGNPQIILVAALAAPEQLVRKDKLKLYFGIRPPLGTVSGEVTLYPLRPSHALEIADPATPRLRATKTA